MKAIELHWASDNTPVTVFVDKIYYFHPDGDNDGDNTVIELPDNIVITVKESYKEVDRMIFG